MSGIIIGLGGSNSKAITITAIIAWDGASIPIPANIPAGVVVTYQGTSYTGTLTASSTTKKNLYLVKSGSGIDSYDEYMTVTSGSSYAWEKVGSTRIDLSAYRTSAAQDVIDTGLQDQINTLKNTGRFLALWNCATGLPYTNPTSLPYTYKAGDYFRVNMVAGSYIHNITMSGNDYSGNAYSVSFSITNSVLAPYSNVQSIITALYNAGHIAHSGTCPATGTITDQETSEVRTLGYVAADGTNGLLLQDSITSAIGTVLSDAAATITDTVSGGTVNYKPTGTSYTGAASTVIETEDVKVGWQYYFDGTQWIVQRSSSESAESTTNKVTSLSSSSTDEQYPSAKAVYDVITENEEVTSEALNALNTNKEAQANKVTSLSSSSTDAQYPSAKCVYDLVGNVESLLAAI